MMLPEQIQETEPEDHELPPFLALGRRTGVIYKRGSNTSPGLTFTEYCQLVGKGEASRIVWNQLQQRGFKIIKG